MPDQNEHILQALARLLRERNLIDKQLSQLIGRPSHPGHLGEFIASQVFDIALHPSATVKASDGVFQSGPLSGRTVNVKWYSKRSSVLDLVESRAATDHADFYLVLTGSAVGPTSRGTALSWTIEAGYLFETHALLEDQLHRGVTIGIASSVPNRLWHAAMIYPDQVSTQLILTEEQRTQLKFFQEPIA